MQRFFLMFIFLMVMLPVIPFPHPGGDMMMIPFNVFLWEMAAGVVFVGGLLAYRYQRLVLPAYWLLLAALPAGLILPAVISTAFSEAFLFRLAALMLGFLFFLSLFQFGLRRRDLMNVCYLLLAGLFMYSLIGVAQILPGRPLAGLIVHPSTPGAEGVFMQPNIMASAMATALVLAFYLMSSPDFTGRKWLLRWLLYGVVLTTTLTLFATGSRIGLIGLLIALPLMLAARFKVLRHKKPHLALALCMLVVGGVSGSVISDGIWRAYSKLERLSESGAEARVHMYGITAEMFLDAPLLGHGVASFPREFVYSAADYMSERGGKALLGHGHFTHPHNEILLWAMEGGLLALAGVFLAAAAVLLQVYRLGWQKGGAMLALLLPVALHTQTELPFYSSVFHWLLFLILLYLLFERRQGGNQVRQYTNKVILAVLPVLSTIVLLATLYICTTTFMASRDIYRFMLSPERDVQLLMSAQNNAYFNDRATSLLLSVKLDDELVNGGAEWTLAYIRWMKSHIKIHPSAAAYHDMVLAYRHLDNSVEADRLLAKGLYLFPEHPVILRLKKGG